MLGTLQKSKALFITSVSVHASIDARKAHIDLY